MVFVHSMYVSTLPFPPEISSNNNLNNKIMKNNVIKLFNLLFITDTRLKQHHIQTNKRSVVKPLNNELK